MKLVFGTILYVYLYLFLSAVTGAEILVDQPCAARPIYNRSVVCVCNTTYCDDITRQQPKKGMFVSYTTSENGSRFQKGFGYLLAVDSPKGFGLPSLFLDTTKKYQKVEGFGGAVTDSVGILWKGMQSKLQNHLINSYFSDKGLEYSFVRVPIGSSDFSIRTYSYDDYSGDANLDHFELQYEDTHFKIPMLHEIFKASTEDIYVIGSTWSPPRWMKETTDQNPVCGFLKKEYFQTFANYLLKFLESYEAEGIPFWALSTSNEPSMAMAPATLSSCLGWGLQDLGNWIVNNFGPTIRNSKYNKVKILALDDQRFAIKIALEPMVSNNSKVLDYIDGIAVHYYADSFVSPEVLDHVYDMYSKFVISTEASQGFLPVDKKVDLGSWNRAQYYVQDIIQDLNNGVIGWLDWNICLDQQGGPNVDKNYVDSPVIVDLENMEFVKQPIFYAMGHFSKFIPRGSERIDVYVPPCACVVPHVAFLTPSNTVVVVIYNGGPAMHTAIRLRNKQAIVFLEASSIVTVEFLNE